MHTSPKYIPLELVLSRPTSDFVISGDKEDIRRAGWTTNEYWVLQMAANISKARLYLKKAQERYKKSLGRIMRSWNSEIEEGDLVWMDVLDGLSIDKLSGHT